MYSKKVQSILNKKKLVPGKDIIEVKVKKQLFRGILMPRSYFGDPDAIVIKLDSGYNVGIKYRKDMTIRKLGTSKITIKTLKIKQKKRSPKVVIIGTGGTIMAKLDYRTGGVSYLFKTEELLGAVPEIADIANIKVVNLFSIASEDMTPKHWAKLANIIAQEIKKGADGIVVMHGTDTMHYTAAALSFMLENLPIPVVLTGAQRSTDRGSCDSFLNLKCAVLAATTDIAEVVLCMHGLSSDDFCYIHRGIKCRKCHTSRRDAFKSINVRPIAKIDSDLKFELLSKHIVKPKKKLKLKTKFASIALIKTYPGMELKLPKANGLVIEGTGLGHVPKSTFKILKKFKKPIIITSQCLWGRINMNVYDNGRDLQKLGAAGNLLDMTPETAYIKLGWLLGNYKKKQALELLSQNLRGEITEKSNENEFFEGEP